MCGHLLQQPQETIQASQKSPAHTSLTEPSGHWGSHDSGLGAPWVSGFQEAPPHAVSLATQVWLLSSRSLPWVGTWVCPQPLCWPRCFCLASGPHSGCLRPAS